MVFASRFFRPFSGLGFQTYVNHTAYWTELYLFVPSERTTFWFSYVLHIYYIYSFIVFKWKWSKIKLVCVTFFVCCFLYKKEEFDTSILWPRLLQDIYLTLYIGSWFPITYLRYRVKDQSRLQFFTYKSITLNYARTFLN